MNICFRHSSSDQGFGASITAVDNFEDATSISNAMLMNGTNEHFSDLAIYNDLCSQPGVKSVAVHSVIVRHSDRVVHGFRVTYRTEFHNGRKTMYTQAAGHFFSRGYYTGWGNATHTTLTLKIGEYLSGLIVQQGEILDGVTFITNQRRMHFGGNGGRRIEEMAMNQSKKIVALAGRPGRYSILESIGFYTLPRGWEVIGHFLMLRFLVKKNRAAVAEEAPLAAVNPARIIRFLVKKKRAAVADPACIIVVDVCDALARHILEFLV